MLEVLEENGSGIGRTCYDSRTIDTRLRFTGDTDRLRKRNRERALRRHAPARDYLFQYLLHGRNY